MPSRAYARLAPPPDPAEPDGPPIAALHPVTLVPEPPAARFTRPLTLQSERAFAAAWTNVRRPGSGFSLGPPRPRRPARELLFVRDDGYLLDDPPLSPLTNTRPPSQLWDHPLASAAPFPSDRLWSDAALQRYLAGQRPDPARLFHS